MANPTKAAKQWQSRTAGARDHQNQTSIATAWPPSADLPLCRIVVGGQAVLHDRDRALLGRQRRLGLMANLPKAAKQWQSQVGGCKGSTTIRFHCHCLAARETCHCAETSKAAKQCSMAVHDSAEESCTLILESNSSSNIRSGGVSPPCSAARGRRYGEVKLLGGRGCRGHRDV